MKVFDRNVIVVDWSGGSINFDYNQAVANTRMASLLIAESIDKIIMFTNTTQKFHLIGHSLGAQISGMTAKRVSYRSQIRRVTGLDPAGPGFYR